MPRIDSEQRTQHLNQDGGTSPTSLPDFFVPDLCRVQSVFLLVLLTELVAFLFTLLRPFQHYFDWEYLGLISLFGLWVTLSCASLLCLQRRFMTKLSLKQSVIFAFLTIQSVVTLYSAAALLIFSWHEEIENISWFLLRNNVAGAIIGGTVLRYFYLQHQSKHQKQSILKARLEALQSRIRPHFLFNSLNSIAGLIMINQEKAEEALLDLSELFRASLKTDRLLVPLEEELSLCRKYLNIEQIRLGERLKIIWDIQVTSNDLKIPPLTLQPLAENAVYHGIEPLSEGGIVEIKIYEETQYLYILISNPEPLLKQGSSSSGGRGHQIAYHNIRDRIENIFGETAILKSSQQNGIYIVTLRLPKNHRAFSMGVTQ